MLGRLPLDEQLVALKSVLARNDVLLEILGRAASLNLPGWYLTAGCVFQTVWNVVTGRLPTNGIKDYDLFYFDDSDLSWQAEDRVIDAARSCFADLPVEVEVRNEARVPLVRTQVRCRQPAISLDRSRDRLLRRDNLLPGDPA